MCQALALNVAKDVEKRMRVTADHHAGLAKAFTRTCVDLLAARTFTVAAFGVREPLIGQEPALREHLQLLRSG